MAVEIVYETHATTTDNEAGVSTGWLPGRLSAQGRREARELGERRRGQDLAVVFTSDLRRSVETVRLAFPDGRPPIRQDARLRECDYGELNGGPSSLVAARRAGHLEVPFPGGQSYRQVLDATGSFLREVAREWEGRRVLVIAHTANLWALECLLAGACLPDLLAAPFVWQAGWSYTLPTGWGGRAGEPAPPEPRPG
ncbi:histidine phosphatase family protein [Streptomyces hoynatensis]|uniref:phosphoglycerate mutase (2,3-diphosphoglycerate-dependent) n=1 Tax=Streptomyces hoynatensis TaxID=1141874 RepID=A0A3A9Z771_9ACTN|nr:histidine phosphatase family protein [Streptomyces hoynatensis]RKN43754.1 histidine phosphatase family protein [Streptomyces hoynatensis]